MESNERMALLLAQVKKEEVDAYTNEMIALDMALPIQALMLLLRVADQDGIWIFSSISLHLDREGKDRYPLSFVMTLSPASATDIALTLRLEALGFLERQETENAWEFMLTPKGAFAVSWWLDCLEDCNLEHESMSSLSVWLSSSTPSTTAS